jgi:methionyl-tRNA formyltransferase
MDKGIDTGDILYQKRLRVRRSDNVESLYGRMMEWREDLMGRLIKDADNESLHPIAQPREGASYYSSVDEEDFRLSWSWSAEKLRHWITITPGQCFFDRRDTRIHFMDAEVVRSKASATPGVLLHVGKEKCVIATGTNAIALRRIQTDADRVLSMAEECRKLGLKKGDSIL